MLVFSITSSIVACILCLSTLIGFGLGLSAISYEVSSPYIRPYVQEVYNILKGEYISLPLVEQAEIKKWQSDIVIYTDVGEKCAMNPYAIHKELSKRWTDKKDALKNHQYDKDPTYRNLFLGYLLEHKPPPNMQWGDVPKILQKTRREYLKKNASCLNTLTKMYSKKNVIPHLGLILKMEKNNPSQIIKKMTGHAIYIEGNLSCYN